ncbi:MAG: hypothetical protein H7Z42_05475, partial [Roseiflexaceae bacterium]|nr:hypothetical protein [Roseiflexaceae bacterium]
MPAPIDQAGLVELLDETRPTTGASRVLLYNGGTPLARLVLADKAISAVYCVEARVSALAEFADVIADQRAQPSQQ